MTPACVECNLYQQPKPSKPVHGKKHAESWQQRGVAVAHLLECVFRMSVMSQTLTSPSESLTPREARV